MCDKECDERKEIESDSKKGNEDVDADRIIEVIIQEISTLPLEKREIIIK